MFMSFFWKKAKTKNKHVVVDDMLYSNRDDTQDEDSVADPEAEDDERVMADDDGHETFNQASILDVRERAIWEMEEKGIIADDDEYKLLATIMPKVSEILILLNLLTIF